MDKQEITAFFNQYFEKKLVKIVELPPSGSSRKNYILQNEDGRFVATFNTNIPENKAFFYYSALFAELNLNTPKVLQINASQNLYVQTFVGAESLSDIISQEGESPRVKDLVRQSLAQLYRLQKSTQNTVDYANALEYESYNILPVLNDLFYFKNFFIDIAEITYQKGKLIEEFLKIVTLIEELSPRGLMLRDFQARNIMVHENQVYFIDYQSSMEGPLMYDVVSFLFQAKANFSHPFREEMIDFYLNLWEDDTFKTELKNAIKPLILVRFLQVLGAYGFRGLVQKKAHFLQSIEKGVENLQEFVKNWEEMQQFPELKKLILALNSNQYKI